MTQQLRFDFGPNAINHYKRLNYTLWHAIGEFVDNATQSYADHREELDAVLRKEDERFYVRVTYDRKRQHLSVVDNAMGMDMPDLARALQVGQPPENPTGRSRYGFGLKTAACWLAETWTIETTKLGSPKRFTVDVSVPRLATGDYDLHPHESTVDPQQHYTKLTIKDHHREFHGNTIRKVGNYLRSMYREDLRRQSLLLEWHGKQLEWSDEDFGILTSETGEQFRKPFEFQIGGKRVHGWVGILDRGSRSKAGFSILQAGRVILGWPDSWRPERIYGPGGVNDLVNQRLFGEIFLDGFEVSQQKDRISWWGDEEAETEDALWEACVDYIEVAKTRRKQGDHVGPGPVQTAIAVAQFSEELSSPALEDVVALEEVPAPEIIWQSFEPLRRSVASTAPDISIRHPELLDIDVYMAKDPSPNDPYVYVEASRDDSLTVIINMRHPHFEHLEDSPDVLEHLRHCVYDGLAEWKARRLRSDLQPDTITAIKNGFLRIAPSLELHRPSG